MSEETEVSQHPDLSASRYQMYPLFKNLHHFQGNRVTISVWKTFENNTSHWSVHILYWHRRAQRERGQPCISAGVSPSFLRLKLAVHNVTTDCLAFGKRRLNERCRTNLVIQSSLFTGCGKTINTTRSRQLAPVSIVQVTVLMWHHLLNYMHCS